MRKRIWLVALITLFALCVSCAAFSEETSYTVRFLVNGKEVYSETVVAGGSATPPTVEKLQADGVLQSWQGIKWDGGYDNVNANLNISGTVIDTPVVVESHFSRPSGKPGKKVTIAIPFAYFDGDESYTNLLNGKSSPSKYSSKNKPAKYNQAFCDEIVSLTVYLNPNGSTTQSPFASKNDNAKKFVIENVSQKTYEKLGFEPAPGQTEFIINRGFAVFTPTIRKTDVENKTYQVPIKVVYKLKNGTENSYSLTVPVKVTGVGSSSGGGGGSSTGKAAAKARLLIDDIYTDPAEPSAGDSFDVVLELRNTSVKYYLHNIQFTLTSENDSLIPVDGTPTQYIEKIDVNSSYELRIPVRSKPDIESSTVKLDVNIDFEDKKMNALTTTQSLTLPIKQVQRIQLDEPSLPTTSPTVGDSYEIKMGVFNLGKTILYNVTAVIVPNSDQVVAGSSYYCGNMEPGTSKTAELEMIPLAGGEYEGEIQVSYETVDGVKTVATKKVKMSAQEEEDFSEFENDPSMYEPVEPEVPEAPAALSILRALPWQVYAAAGLLILILVVALSAAARRRRVRSLEDDEMD